MKQHTLLGIAAALTAFVLVLIGALAGQILQSSAPVTSVATDAVADPVVVSTEAPASAPAALDPAMEALIREREAAYQQALEEANKQLAEANRRLEAANRQVAQQMNQQQSAPAPQAPAAAQPAYPISTEQAQAIALGLANGATLARPAELVLYQTTPAYEVIFDRGAVYIDAQTGAMLASTLTQPQPQPLAQPVAQTRITPDQAAQIAIAYRGGGAIRKIELEHKRGVEAYEVKFTDSAKVYVAASDGAVVYARLDKASERKGDDHKSQSKAISKDDKDHRDKDHDDDD